MQKCFQPFSRDWYMRLTWYCIFCQYLMVCTIWPQYHSCFVLKVGNPGPENEVQIHFLDLDWLDMLHIADYDIQKVLDRLTRTKYMASFFKKPFCMFISPNYLHVVFKLFLSHFIAFMISSLQLIAGPEKFLLVFFVPCPLRNNFGHYSYLQ